MREMTARSGGAREDSAREFRPVCFAGAGHMKDAAAGRRAVVNKIARNSQDSLRYVGRVRRRPDLVADNADLFARFRESEHCRQKILAFAVVDPACAQDRMLGRCSGHSQFAGKFGAPVNVDGRDCICLDIWRRFGSIEYVVGRNLNEGDVDCSGGLRQRAGRDTVDLHRQIFFLFRLIHHRVGGGVDKDIGARLLHQAIKILKIFKIKVWSAESENFDVGYRGLAQGARDLPVLT